MLNEPSGMNDAAPVVVPARLVAEPDSKAVLRSQIRRAVDDVFLVEFETYELPEPVTVSFQGQLLTDSMEAYDRLDAAFKELDHTPMFLTVGTSQVIRAVSGRIAPAPRPLWPNALLLGLTILSLLVVSMQLRPDQTDISLGDFLSGWPYVLCVMLIFGARELGHYWAARYHKVSVSLPYFLPFPWQGSPGALGSLIQFTEPVRNRRVLLDIGAAGPLLGLLVAIPILLIGLKTSPLEPAPVNALFTLQTTTAHYGMEGNSVLYLAAKYVVFGRILPDGMSDVFINQVAWAGWTGLLVLALHLIPVGQLDGGNALYSLIGDKARVLYFPALAVLAALWIWSKYDGWLIWLVLILVFGRISVTPLDMITQLDPRRRVLSIVTLILFLLVFVPLPALEIVVGSPH